MAATTSLPTLKPDDFKTDQEVRWCPGCGDYSILAQMKKAIAPLGIPREKLVFISGIGCSSRFPYYMNTYGFHTIHGRAPAFATGLKVARPDLTVWVITGDGDGLSIGGNHFLHALRRNIDLKLVLFNNEIYGLTKGQFSATADLGSKLKSGVLNDLPPIDTCALAIQLGATLVGRSFSGDKRQLGAMLKAAIAHKGTVMLDVVSPCVTFNDHEGSTKSYKYVKEHEETLQDVSFVPHFEEIDVEYDPGTTTDVTMHDGSHLRLRKLEEDFDPTDKIRAMTRLGEAHEKGEVLTGIFYVNPEAPNFLDMLNVVDQPLATLPDSMTRPGKEVLDVVMEELR